MYFEKRF